MKIKKSNYPAFLEFFTRILLILLVGSLMCLAALAVTPHNNNFDIPKFVSADAYPFPPIIESKQYVSDEDYKVEPFKDFDKYLSVAGLKSKLDIIARDRPCVVTMGRLKIYVLAVSPDKKQVLYSHACGGTGYERNFLIWQKDQWVDTFNQVSKSDMNLLIDVPNCLITDKYSLDTLIAPVCYTVRDGYSAVYAGDTRNYQFITR